jgi:hypothetical protein
VTRPGESMPSSLVIRASTRPRYRRPFS